MGFGICNLCGGEFVNAVQAANNPAYVEYKEISLYVKPVDPKVRLHPGCLAKIVSRGELHG